MSYIFRSLYNLHYFSQICVIYRNFIFDFMKFLFSVTIFFFLFFWPLSGFSQSQNHPFVEKFLLSGALNGASVGLMVDDLSQNKTLISVNPDLLLAPASVTKIVSSAVAFELLGSNFRFKTLIGYTGSIDEKSGRLSGDWVIRGGGDPAMESAKFEKNGVSAVARIVGLIDSLKIKTIDGDIVLDLSLFEQQTLPCTWTWEDIGNYYGTAPAAINVLDNTVKLLFNSPATARKATQLVLVSPELENMEWKNEVLSSQVNQDMAYVFGGPWDTQRVIRGTIPAGRQGFEVKASMPNPPVIFGKLLKEKMLESGITLKGEIKYVYDSPVEAQFFSEILSPSLTEICKVLNHESINLIGESLILQLALQKNGKGVHDDGLQILGEYLETNVSETKFFLADGSGLSRYNALSARQLNNLLKFMHNSGSGAKFKSTLPSAGVATLRSFDTKKFPARTLRCKSGSITRVRAYSGYLTAKSGKELAFTVMVNNFSGASREVFVAIEELLYQIRETM